MCLLATGVVTRTTNNSTASDFKSFRTYLNVMAYLPSGFILQSTLLSDKTTVILITDNKTQGHELIHVHLSS